MPTLSTALSSRLSALLDELSRPSPDTEATTFPSQVTTLPAIESPSEATASAEPVEPIAYEPTPYRGRRSRRSRFNPNWREVDKITLDHDAARDSLELRFLGKPGEAVRDMLKTNGWRWNPVKGCWYCRRTAASLHFASSFVAAAE